MERKELLPFLVLAMVLVTVASARSAINNVIQNGDFEEGDIGWTSSARGLAAMTLSIDKDEAAFGDQCAKLQIQNLDGTGMHDLTLDCNSAISIKAGNTYTVDFWIKAEEDRTIAIDFLKNHDPWTNAFRVENIAVTKDWQVQHHSFKAPFSDANMIFLFSLSKGSNKNPKATFWVDHVRFYEGEYQEQELPGSTPRALDANGKLLSSWAKIRQRS